MNIKEAKEQIKNAMKAYFSKNEYGNLRIPVEKQRPIFLMGPPGIGKTAIMEQVAQELEVGLVSYSMTHHTRQSALGLPVITTKTYGGREYDVSEYTMSEIIASVYNMIEDAGLKEGILFLDEVNCVSETLSPIMLKFLQYKEFGCHRVPEGWIIVTAGNPPEYNNSVREYDIVTWDRLKRIDVEPDYKVWKEYAYKKAVHGSITTYLDIKKTDFYRIETTVDGKTFVTARGWEDLSEIIKIYEENDIPVDYKLTAQYLQDNKIAREYAVYYDLYKKYKSDYQVETILEGKASQEIKNRANAAKFDERLSLIGLLLNMINQKIREEMDSDDLVNNLLETLKNARLEMHSSSEEPIIFLNKSIDSINRQLEANKTANTLTEERKKLLLKSATFLQDQSRQAQSENIETIDKLFVLITSNFNNLVKEVANQGKKLSGQMDNIFTFAEEVFGEGNEILVIVTELTANYYSSRFISRFGSQAYFKHNKELLFYERQKELISKLESKSYDL